MLDYNAKTNVKQLEGAKADINEGDGIELKGKKPQDFSILGYNAKVLKVPEGLNEAGDMTAGFFKTKVLMFG